MIGVAVAAPWFIAMEHAHPGYLDYYLLQRHVLGFTTATQRHGKSAWHYYLPVVLGGGLPWILYAPFTTAGRRPRASDPLIESRFTDATRLGWSLLLTGTVFLSLSKSKLLTYALPLFPAIALLAAVAWLAWQQRSGDHPSRWFGRMPAVQAAYRRTPPARRRSSFAPAKFPVPHVGWMWVVAAAIAAGWWVAARVVSRHTEAAAALGATMTAATLIVALAVLVPPVANVTTAKDLAETINRSGRFPARAVDGRSSDPGRWSSISIRRCGAASPASASCSCPRRRCRSTSRCPARACAITFGDSPRLARYLQLEGQPYVPAGHYRMYDGDRLLHSRRAAEPTACCRPRSASQATARPAVRCRAPGAVDVGRALRPRSGRTALGSSTTSVQPRSPTRDPAPPSIDVHAARERVLPPAPFAAERSG